METIKHTVTANDTLQNICAKYNINVDLLIAQNIMKYPGLANNPFMLFQNWVLTIPLVNNGGDTQYDLF